MRTTDLIIAAGEMRDRIHIERAARSTDASTGEQTLTWSTWRLWWAQIVPLGGAEIERGKLVAATVSHAAMMRYCPGMLPSDRIRYGAQILNINALIDVQNRRVKHVAYCTELVDQT